ncbi:hypothetical protein LCGC14_3084320 [marine sediment metagenome]|uniref:Type II toxin-antitoxin system RelE/ParE family toxin n=1 Tax=marine sediment metagenome TaxID=412755 RepID=A0A0F8YJZ9_9ZZZZ
MTPYTVYITPSAWKEIKNLPGKIRQRVKRVIDAFNVNPHPAKSKALDKSDLPGFYAELWRVRLDKWRIIYAINKADNTVDVLAVRKRPPYDYGDLEEMLGKLL